MSKNEYTYDQSKKRIIRHRVLSSAVKFLTQERENVACVSRDYVRKVYDSFTNSEEDSLNKRETQLIDRKYIISWENLHDAYTSKKEVRDLTVCYLCGPEPNNDFQELTELGAFLLSNK